MEAVMNSPIISGAIPTSQAFQFNSFLTKKIIAVKIDITLAIKPTNVTILSGSFECFTIPRTPMSQRV